MNAPRIFEWLRGRLRAIYPPRPFSEFMDDISHMQKEALERNEAATAANIEASNIASDKAAEAVRRALARMEAGRNETH